MRADLKENLSKIDEECLPVLSQRLENAKWSPKSSSKSSFLETPLGATTELLVRGVVRTVISNAIGKRRVTVSLGDTFLVIPFLTLA